MKNNNKAKKLIKKILSKARQIKRNITQKRDNTKAIFKVTKKMDNYISDFLDEKIERFTAIPKKPELIGEKIIWQYWHQEINENTSKIVIKCLNSVKKHSNGYEIIMLTNETVKDYVDLPDFVWEKLGNGKFDITKLSNLIRLSLLSAYGGVWIDATVYLSKPIEDSLLQKDFFAFQRSELPPSDANIYKRLNSAYFSWNPKFQIRLLTSFMIAKPNNKIVNDILSILLEYWRRESLVEHYFFFQICFNRMMHNSEWKSLNCELSGDTDCHKFQTVISDKFDLRMYEEIAAKCSVHKLTYFKQENTNGTFADFFLRVD